MPNWTNNFVEITGTKEKLEEIKKTLYTKCKHSEDAYVFDFNKIIKMPEDFNIKSCSFSQGALLSYCRKNNLDIPIPDNGDNESESYTFCSYISEMTKDEIKNSIKRYEKYMREENKLDNSIGLPDNYGERLYNNIKNYESPTWYEWRHDHWGTKWNACRDEIERDIAEMEDGNYSILYYFQTAWCPPIEIIVALGKKYPDVKIRAEFNSWESGFKGHILMINGEEKEYICEEYDPLEERAKEYSTEE